MLQYQGEAGRLKTARKVPESLEFQDYHQAMGNPATRALIAEASAAIDLWLVANFQTARDGVVPDEVYVDTLSVNGLRARWEAAFGGEKGGRRLFAFCVWVGFHKDDDTWIGTPSNTSNLGKRAWSYIQKAPVASSAPATQTATTTAPQATPVPAARSIPQAGPAAGPPTAPAAGAPTGPAAGPAAPSKPTARSSPQAHESSTSDAPFAFGQCVHWRDRNIDGRVVVRQPTIDDSGWFPVEKYIVRFPNLFKGPPIDRWIEREDHLVPVDDARCTGIDPYPEATQAPDDGDNA